MKTLLLLRHGKSDWKADYAEDLDRPLAKRGKRAAALMGRYLAELAELPDRVYTSPALRARDTARRAVVAGGWSRPVETCERLYGGPPDQIVELIREADEGAGCIILVGHEPDASLIASGLTGGTSVRFPTAAMARIDLGVERWDETGFGKGTLIWLVTPKLLAGIGWPDGVS